MALRTRADLVNEALSNLGIIVQADASGTRTRVDFVTEVMGNLGLNQQAYVGNARTRENVISEALSALGINRQAFSGNHTRTRDDLVDEAMQCFGVVQRTPTVGAGTKTTLDLVNLVLFNIGVLGEGQTASAEAVADVTKSIQPIVRDLDARGIVTIPDINAIDNLYFYNLGAIIAEALKEQYGVTGEDASALIADAKQAEFNLKVVTRRSFVDEKLDNVMAELSARQIATVAVPVVTVPAEWYPALAACLADSTKGKFDLPAETVTRLASERVDAERKLRTLTANDMINEFIDAVATELKARAIVSLTIPVADVPEQWCPAFATIVAAACAPRFDWLSDTVIARVTAEAAAAELKLRTMTGTSLVDEKVPAIFAELNARAIATVSDPNVIPNAWFGLLADIAAESVRAKFNVSPEIAQRVTGRAALAERTLKNLNRAFIIERNLDNVLADLAAREIVYLVNSAAIPDEWFLHLAAIVADRCKAKGFDLDTITLQRVTADGAQAMMDLRELTRGRPSYNTLRTSFM